MADTKELKRPIVPSFMSGNVRSEDARYMDEATAYMDAQDAEIAELRRKLEDMTIEARDAQGGIPGLRGAWKFEWDRAEAAEAHVATLEAELAAEREKGCEG